jgi:hypothetical protein
MINFSSLRGNVVADHSLQRFCFCGLVLIFRVKQAAKRQAKQCTALVLPYKVKQAVKRQAKQCTALFCPHPLTMNFFDFFDFAVKQFCGSSVFFFGGGGGD